MLLFKKNETLESHEEHGETASRKAAVKRRLYQNIMEVEKGRLITEKEEKEGRN